MKEQRTLLLVLILGFMAVLSWSAWKPHDYFTWFLEVVPALLGAFILALTRRRFPLTSLLYILIWLHAVVLMVGGHYTYAEVPLFNWLRDGLHLSRNYYDRVGHFMQGFVPALLVREILIRKSPLKSGGWLFFVVISICMAISASYELFEWGVAVATGSAADAFLGSQGDVWDTQWDMFLALLGAFMAIISLSKYHNLAIKNASN